VPNALPTFFPFCDSRESARNEANISIGHLMSHLFVI
jgi:hypothetical protein